MVCDPPLGVSPLRTVLRCGVYEELLENSDEVVQTNQVAVLMVAFPPGGPVVQLHAFGQWRSLAEIYHPDVGLVKLVMHEKQRTANHLQRQQEGGKLSLMFVYLGILAQIFKHNKLYKFKLFHFQ